jgi:hypothetical protein
MSTNGNRGKEKTKQILAGPLPGTFLLQMLSWELISFPSPPQRLL